MNSALNKCKSMITCFCNHKSSLASRPLRKLKFTPDQWVQKVTYIVYDCSKAKLILTYGIQHYRDSKVSRHGWLLHNNITVVIP